MPRKCIPDFPTCAISWGWISPGHCRCRRFGRRTQEQIARILSSWEAALADMARSGGFLFGRFSIADCMYAPVVSRFTTYGVETSAPIRDYMARIRALPAMQSWLAASKKEVEDGIV